MLIDVPALIQQCAPMVSPVLMRSLIRKESSFNPFAIGLHDAAKPKAQAGKPLDQVQQVLERLQRNDQPTGLDDALQVVDVLETAKLGFSVGLAQISIGNVKAAGMTWRQAFDPCTNLTMGQQLLWDFFRTARNQGYSGADAVFAGLRGYNSGSVHPGRGKSNEYAAAIFEYVQKGGGFVPNPQVAQVTASKQEEWEGEGEAVSTLQAQEVFDADGGKEGF